MNAQHELRELQFLSGLPPAELVRLLRRYRADWRGQTVRRVLQLLVVGVLAKFAARRGAADILPEAKRAAPIFVVGHWRSGTSALQKLLCCDSRFSTPSFADCLAPAAGNGLHAWFLERVAAKLPSTRGFDAFPLALDEVFEDEFALLKLTLESPMLAYVFPKQAERIWAHFITATPSAAWRRACREFISRSQPPQGHLLLKSPAHAFRIATLAAMFPAARFINIVRDPVDVFLSTCALERHLLANNALQFAASEPDENRALARQCLHAQAIARARGQLPSNRFAELTFESLQASPRDQLNALCERLELGGFSPDLSRFSQMVERFRAHRRNWPRDRRTCLRVEAAMAEQQEDSCRRKEANVA